MNDLLSLSKTFEHVALLGGVYNNHIALDTACRKATDAGCEAIFCLGDLGGFGPNPNKIFPLLDKWNVQCIQGNYEESLIARTPDCGCGYTHPKDNHYAQLSYDYTHRELTDENRRRMESYPHQMRFNLGPKVVHLCHGSPRRVNEFLWETTTSDSFLRSMADQHRFDILATTHTGLPWKREFSPGRWMVNVGVLGRPANENSQRVWYAELTWSRGNLSVQLLPLEYDWRALADEMRLNNLPQEFIDTITSGYWTTCLEILPGKERERGRY